MQKSRKRKENLQKVMEKVHSLFSFYAMSDDSTGLVSSMGKPSAQAEVDEDELYSTGSSNLPEQLCMSDHDEEQTSVL